MGKATRVIVAAGALTAAGVLAALPASAGDTIILRPKPPVATITAARGTVSLQKADGTLAESTTTALSELAPYSGDTISTGDRAGDMATIRAHDGTTIQLGRASRVVIEMPGDFTLLYDFVGIAGRVTITFDPVGFAGLASWIKTAHAAALAEVRFVAGTRISLGPDTTLRIAAAGARATTIERLVGTLTTTVTGLRGGTRLEVGTPTATATSVDAKMVVAASAERTVVDSKLGVISLVNRGAPRRRIDVASGRRGEVRAGGTPRLVR